MNYDWMYDALFPGSVAESDYGHYVMAVFPRPGLVFKPTIRSGMCVDAYFQADRAKEFWTDDRVQYTDSLLLTSAAEFELLLDRRATSRAGALDILCRTEDEQRISERSSRRRREQTRPSRPPPPTAYRLRCSFTECC